MVMLKEERQFILFPRETSFDAIHLLNMINDLECGAILPDNLRVYLKPIH